MWPWGHAAVGYLCYTVYCRYRHDRGPQGVQAIALAVGTQFPDLVDKTLAWQFGLLPNGRSLAHSLLVASLFLGILWVLTDGSRRSAVTAFGIGYLTHLFGDALYPLVTGEFSYVGFLAWPLVPAIEYDVATGGFLAHVFALGFGPEQSLELGLTVVALVLWYRDGRPGVGVLLPDALRWSDDTDEQPDT